MKVIVITLPESDIENEASRIADMLEIGTIDRVHIRKPGMSVEDMRELISVIPSELYCRISIHSHPELLVEFPGLGWHFSANRPADPFESLGESFHTHAWAPEDQAILRSRSCHSPAEATEWATECDYVMLSPVFDSISKPGYLSACFNPVEEYLCCQTGNVVALGGVTPQRIPRLKERGYYGAAMLGYAWQTEFNKLIEELKCYNS